MELELFNSLIGPILFAMGAGVYGFVKRPEKRDQLLLALACFLVTAGALFARFPSPQLFNLLVPFASLVTVLYALDLRQTSGGRPTR